MIGMNHGYPEASYRNGWPLSNDMKIIPKDCSISMDMIPGAFSVT